jgi:HSP20 family molecular chaperone IbpA
MFKLYKFNTDIDNMFNQMDALFNYPLSSDNTKKRGLKSIIKRPHNLITIKDENGKICGYQLETVYTPFSKEDIKIEIKNGNSINVKCGMENKVKDVEMDYCGISYQSYEFTLPLAESTDITNITAKAEDGMLIINIPLEKEEPKEDCIEIKIQ